MGNVYKDTERSLVLQPLLVFGVVFSLTPVCALCVGVEIEDRCSKIVCVFVCIFIFAAIEYGVYHNLKSISICMLCYLVRASTLQKILWHYVILFHVLLCLHLHFKCVERHTCV